MRKSTLFISTVLTMFMMATLFGVVSAYQQIVKNQTEAAQAPMAQIAPVMQEVNVQPVSMETAVVSPEQATIIASTFLNDTGVYSVETVDYEGVVAYLITFSSGKLVYVSTTGDILAITEIPPVVVASNNRGGNSGGNNSGNSGGGGGDHEEHDDEDGDD